MADGSPRRPGHAWTLILGILIGLAIAFVIFWALISANAS